MWATKPHVGPTTSHRRAPLIPMSSKPRQAVKVLCLSYRSFCGIWIWFWARSRRPIFNLFSPKTISKFYKNYGIILIAFIVLYNHLQKKIVLYARPARFPPPSFPMHLPMKIMSDTWMYLGQTGAQHAVCFNSHKWRTVYLCVHQRGETR